MKDFSKKTLAQLAKKDISILGVTAVPGFDGDIYFSGTAYMLAYGEKGFVRTHSQVIICAASSWDPEINL